MPANRVHLPCYICEAENQRGGNVQTVFARLLQHLKTAHGMTVEQAGRAAAMARMARTGRKVGAGFRSSTGRKYVECVLDGCGKMIINKSRHLSSTHKLQKNTAEFLTAMSTSFRAVGNVNRRNPLVGLVDVPPQRPIERRDQPRQEEWRPEPMDVQEEAPRVALEPQVRANPSSISTSDDEENPTAATDRQELDLAMELETPVNKRFMGPRDVTFQKWQRLVPEGCQPFTVVKKWHYFRMERAGGSKKEDQQKNSLGYVNRFLAHCDFQECDWKSVTPSMVSKHDAELSKHYEAGTVSRILQTILDFWIWARTNRYLRRQHFEKVKEYLEGCLRSSRKDVGERNTQRRVDEVETLPGPDVLKAFEESEYVRKLREAFRASPFLFLYDMACVLIVLCSFYNGPRVSVFHNIRFKDVENASTDDGEDFTITVGKHKTSGQAGGRSRKAAFITVSKDLYNDFLLYSRTVRDIFKFVDPSATVFRSRTGERVTTNRLGKMAKLAWKKSGMTAPMSLTILRKLSTVQGRLADPSMASSIARQLCHRQSTADQYYAIHDDRQEARKVYRHLKHSFSKPTATVTSTQVSSSSLVSDAELLPQQVESRTTTDVISESTVNMEQQSTVTADSDVVPPSVTGKSLPQFTAVPLLLSPVVRLTRLRSKDQPSMKKPETETEEQPTAAETPKPPPSPPPTQPLASPVMPVLSPAPSTRTPEMPQLSPPPTARPMAHYSKYVPIVQFTPPSNYKKRTRLDPATRHEIREAYQEVILDYMMTPFRSVPIQAIRDFREGRWPDLSEMQLRDMVRNMVKSERKKDILMNPDDYLCSP